MKRRGFYYCKPHEVTYLLLAWKHNDWFRACVNRELLPMIVLFLKEYISVVPFQGSKFSARQEKWIHEWISKRKTIMSVPQLYGRSYLSYWMMSLIPSHHSILIIVRSDDSSAYRMTNFVRANALFNVQVATLETICVEPNTFDFVFADGVKCDFSPRGKFLCIHHEGEE
jgi:hypothetical protein